MKLLYGLAFVALLGIVGLQLYRLEGERRLLAGEAREFEEKVAALRAERDEVRADIAYYSKPENLLNQIRAFFNRTRPGEELFVVVPAPTGPAPQTP